MQLQQNVSSAVRAKGSLGAFAYDVATALGIDEKAVSGTLHALAARGTLRREKVRSELKGKAVWRYWFVEQGQAKLPLIQMPADSMSAAQVIASAPDVMTLVPSQAAAQVEHVVSVGAVRFKLEIGPDVFEVSYAEARTLYDVLNVIFGGR